MPVSLPIINPQVEDDYADELERVGNDIAKKYRELLGLEPTYSRGTLLTGRRYGIILPTEERNITGGQQGVINGFHNTRKSMDVVYTIVVADSVEVFGACMKHGQYFKQAIAMINILVENGARVAGLTLPSYQIRTTQQVNPPHAWEITFVGTATLEIFAFRDKDGVHQNKVWGTTPMGATIANRC